MALRFHSIKFRNFIVPSIVSAVDVSVNESLARLADLIAASQNARRNTRLLPQTGETCIEIFAFVEAPYDDTTRISSIESASL